jgi:hypothetical protein
MTQMRGLAQGRGWQGSPSPIKELLIFLITSRVKQLFLRMGIKQT